MTTKTRRAAALGIAGALAAATAAMVSAARAEAQSPAALQVNVAAGYRLETIARDLKAPRAVVQTDALTAWVVEFGGWGERTGSLVRLTRSSEASPWASKRVATKLDRPVSLAKGPDGKLYVGEVKRVLRFDPISAATASTVKLEPVITDIPGKGLHPLTAFAFAANGDLIVNVGAPTNNCEKSKGKPQCPDAEGPSPFAALRRYRWDAASKRFAKPTVIARGLRNSMGLVVHPSGTIMQAENSRDAINEANPKLSDDTLPHDELNVIVDSANYGWPYCFDNARNAPEFPKYACTATSKPHVLLPAHSAPLGLSYWRDSLVVSLHGYRETGHRLVAFPVDASGKVTGPSSELISGWDEVDDQLFGGPVQSSVGLDGALWFTDDRNNLVLRLAAK